MRIKRSIVASAAALLAACAADSQLITTYASGEHAEVRLADRPAHTPPVLHVYLHPEMDDRAAVRPSMGWQLNHINDGWIATVDRQRQAYTEILIRLLADKGRRCKIKDATPYPDFAMFEFRFDCAP